MKAFKTLCLLTIVIALGWVALPVEAQTAVANSAADMAGRIVMLANSTTPRTVTNYFTFDRDPSAPFAVTSGSAKVDNLNADLLDGFHASYLGVTFVTTTAAGTQNNFNPGIGAGNTVIQCANAFLLTITGFPAGYNGQMITVIADGAQVDLTPAGGSTFGNQLVNYRVTGNTSLAAQSGGAVGGSAIYVYSTNLSAWRMINHVQGNTIPFSPTWGNSGTANTLGNGALSGSYTQINRVMFFTVSLTFGSTTASGNGTWSLSLPATSTDGAQDAVMNMTDVSVPSVYLGSAVNMSTTVLTPTNNASPLSGLTAAIPFTWATGDNLYLRGWFYLN